jgi:hypothetical protein
MFCIKTAADPVAAAGRRGISLPSPDKFVGLTAVPCGGMPHNPLPPNFALTPAMNPMMMVQMKCMANLHAGLARPIG